MCYGAVLHAPALTVATSSVARQCAACSQWLVLEDGKWVGHHPRNCTIVLAGRA